MKYTYTKHKLEFKFSAKTSRGALKDKETYIIKVFDENNPEIFGLGECSTIPNLSLDPIQGYEERLVDYLNQCPKALSEIYQLEGIENYPSIIFGLETALMDLFNGGRKIIFDNDFSKGKTSLPINGLIWMGDKEFMFSQLKEKLKQNYTCIKIKIGAIDFKQECELLQYIRNHFSSEEVIIRVDANGAFSPDEALEKLKVLSSYDIHSIEQPIKQGQIHEMAELCEKTPLDIALDEELIGIKSYEQKLKLIETINPQYIILKPSLLGGIKSAQEWISIVQNLNTEWWMTSALESNVGLNSICQFTANYHITIPQGLGTGQLYHNNFPSGLYLKDGFISVKNEE